MLNDQCKMTNDKCKMINDKCQGFSLIEVLVVISLMALLAVFLGAKTYELFTEDKFYKTCYMMEEIKEAIIGKPGHYCNGVQQFTGYVSDMGNLPNLYYLDEDRLMQKVTRIEFGKIEAIGEGSDGFAGVLKQGLRPQPIALWSKNTGDLTEWKYHEQAQLWAGWRGPYIDPPPSGVLRDAWGNAFLFVIGEVVGHKSEEDEKHRTYRCKKTYASTREKLGRPGTSDGYEYWEVIDEDDEMNFRTWQDLGTAIVKDTDGNELEDYNIPESLQTKQEKFYGAGCLTVISLGADKEPGGKGLDKDISIVIDPTEYMGEVAGNVGNRQELFADKVCLYCPNYTEEGGDIEELCIPESGEMENNSQSLLAYEDPFNPGDLHTGINFRFGTATAMTANTKWSCNCTDGGEGCSCAKYERMNYHCYIKNEDLAPDYPLCKLFYEEDWGCDTLLSDDPCICIAYGSDLGYPEICADECVKAQCKEKVSCEELDSTAAKDWGMELESVTCEEVEYYDVCVEWICDEEMPDCDCTAVSVLSEYDDPNWIKVNVPIGIRSVKADEGSCYMFPVCPGGNWIGTVRGE